MTVFELNDAFTGIDDKYLTCAEEFAADALIKGHRRTQRLIILLAAVITILVCSTVAGFAMHEGFREAVLDLFRVRAVDVVEQTAEADVPISEGSGVTVTRVKVPDFGTAGSGFIYVCSDEIRYNSGNHYDVYVLDGTELLKLERRILDTELDVDGEPRRLYAEWAQSGDRITFTYVEGHDFRLMKLSADPPEVIVYGCKTIWKVDLLDGKSEIIGKASDFGVENFDIDKITPDGKYFTFYHDMGCYIAEFATGKAYRLNDYYSGDAEPQNWSYLGDGKVSFWDYKGGTNVYILDMADGSVKRTITGAAGVKCVMRNGGQYLIRTDNIGDVYAVNVVNGYSTRIEGLTWPDERTTSIDMIPSPEGDKLLIRLRSIPDSVLYRLDVIDFNSLKLITIDRDPSRVGNEHQAEWFDNDTLIVNNYNFDEEYRETGDSWYYLYKIG